jgi:hypothetical protein
MKVSGQKILIVTVILLILMNLTLIGFLWKNYKGNRPSESRTRFNREHFLKERLNLSDRQQQIFDSLRRIHREELRRKEGEIASLRDSLISNLDEEVPDTVVQQLTGRIGALQVEHEKINYRNFREMAQILDSAQREQFLSLTRKAIRFQRDRSESRSRGREPEK